jgi:hypothetical protein
LKHDHDACGRLTHCFPTYAKARDDLMNMWNTVVMEQAEDSNGMPLTNVEKHQARINNKVSGTLVANMLLK